MRSAYRQKSPFRKIEQLVINSESITGKHAKVLNCVNAQEISTANEIAKKLQLPRTETYDILNSLQNMKLVSSKLSKPTKFVSI